MKASSAATQRANATADDQCPFHDLKRSRAVAGRYDKTAVNDLGTMEVARAWLCLMRALSADAQPSSSARRRRAEGPTPRA